MAEPAATQTEPPKTAFGRLADVAVAAIPPLFSAVGVVTFVALVGGAIQWVRFYAAGLPADQAVGSIPKDELVVVGAVSLIYAVLVGALIVLVIFLVERQAVEERKVTMRVLLALTTVQMLFTLILVDAEWWQLVLIAAWIVAWGLVANRTLRGLPSVLSRIASRRRLWAIRSRFERALDDHDDAKTHVELLPPNGGAPEEEVEARNSALRAAAVERQAAQREWARALADWRESGAREIAKLSPNEPPSKKVLLDALRDLAKRERRQPRRRRERRLWISVLAATIAAGAVPLALSDDLRWVLVVVLVVALFGGVNFMIARVTRRFGWYGLALFASIVVFGATLSAVDTIRSPKIQPMALLRNTDERPICGAFVAETDKRVYVARVVEQADGDGIELRFGRVFWVDLDEVDTVSVGPLQDVDDARDRLPVLAAELVRDRPEAKPPAKPVVVTKVVRRNRGRRTVTVTTKRERSPGASGQAGAGGGQAGAGGGQAGAGGQPTASPAGDVTQEPPAVGSCTT